jgi:hypothetical protein
VRALRVGDKHAAEPEAQAELLGETFFPATRTQPCSLTTDFDPEQREARAWRQFTEDELKNAVSVSRPKRDRVTGCGIRTVWRGRRGVDVSRR